MFHKLVLTSLVRADRGADGAAYNITAVKCSNPSSDLFADTDG